MSININRDWVMNLIIECPYNHELDSCPVKEIRNLPMSKRIKIIESMDQSTLNKLIDCHKECTKQNKFA